MAICRAVVQKKRLTNNSRSRADYLYLKRGRGRKALRGVRSRRACVAGELTKGVVVPRPRRRAWSFFRNSASVQLRFSRFSGRDGLSDDPAALDQRAQGGLLDGTRRSCAQRAVCRRRCGTGATPFLAHCSDKTSRLTSDPRDRRRSAFGSACRCLVANRNVTGSVPRAPQPPHRPSLAADPDRSGRRGGRRAIDRPHEQQDRGRPRGDGDRSRSLPQGR